MTLNNAISGVYVSNNIALLFNYLDFSHFISTILLSENKAGERWIKDG